jgi:hypothetical protein
VLAPPPGVGSPAARVGAPRSPRHPQQKVANPLAKERRGALQSLLGLQRSNGGFASFQLFYPAEPRWVLAPRSEIALSLGTPATIEECGQLTFDHGPVDLQGSVGKGKVLVPLEAALG